MISIYRTTTFIEYEISANGYQNTISVLQLFIRGLLENYALVIVNGNISVQIVGASVTSFSAFEHEDINNTWGDRFGQHRA